eukprot:7513739-Alexandrium_andersonii.AAC.1
MVPSGGASRGPWARPLTARQGPAAMAVGAVQISSKLVQAARSCSRLLEAAQRCSKPLKAA